MTHPGTNGTGLGVTTHWQPFREPLRATLTRTVGIAVIVATCVAPWTVGFRRWPALVAVVLWPALGGHVVDLFFLNWLRPRLPADRPIQTMARIVVWFIGGILLALGAGITAKLLLARPRVMWLPWAAAGAAFVALELVAHGAMHLRGRASFYDGLG